jgi:hypothetical protein
MKEKNTASVHSFKHAHAHSREVVLAGNVSFAASATLHCLYRKEKWK